MDQQKFLGLLDMLDGGGAGRSGQTFEGGPLSGFLNALGVRPMGYMDRLEQERMMPALLPRPMAGGSSSAPTSPVPSPLTPPIMPKAGDITTTVLPPVGAMSNEQLMQLIQEAMMRAQTGQRR